MCAVGVCTLMLALSLTPHNSCTILKHHQSEKVVQHVYRCVCGACVICSCVCVYVCARACVRLVMRWCMHVLCSCVCTFFVRVSVLACAYACACACAYACAYVLLSGTQSTHSLSAQRVHVSLNLDALCFTSTLLMLEICVQTC